MMQINIMEGQIGNETTLFLTKYCHTEVCVCVCSRYILKYYHFVHILEIDWSVRRFWGKCRLTNQSCRARTAKFYDQKCSVYQTV